MHLHASPLPWPQQSPNTLEALTKPPPRPLCSLPEPPRSKALRKAPARREPGAPDAKEQPGQGEDHRVAHELDGLPHGVDGLLGARAHASRALPEARARRAGIRAMRLRLRCHPQASRVDCGYNIGVPHESEIESNP